MSIEVVKPGMLTTLQDQGRVGYAALGVSRSGPMDGTLQRLANALVGNDKGAAALEVTLIGPTLRARRDCWIALCGDFARARIDGMPVGAWRTLRLAAGAILDCGGLAHGTRGYLAIDGGVAVDPLLGSRTTDINGRLGPLDGRALRSGDVLPLGAPSADIRLAANWSLDPAPWFDPTTDQPIHCIPGPHFNALDAASQHAMQHAESRVGNDSNRVGLRLDGPPIQLREPLELISEPVSFGTVQLPAGGQPIVLMAEHPTTGGYPRIGQIAAVDLGRLAQRRPGEPVRLAYSTLEQAQTRYRQRERQLGALIRAIHERIRT